MPATLSLVPSIGAHDSLAAGHAARVTRLALALARAVGASAATLDAIRAGGPLHDVGKLDVSDAILCKPGPLDPAELLAIRRHPVTGARLVGRVRSLRHAVGCVRHHHERWDGDGYPDRLVAARIPLEARILAVADAYDAMTSRRPYHDAITHHEALLEVERCAGSQFDPRLAAAFLELR